MKIRSLTTAQELLAAAGKVLEQPPASASGVWPRAAAYLGRQAFEMLLDELWGQRAPGTERVSLRAQMICLPFYLEDELAGRLAWTWQTLSNACHQHPYELAPTAAELRQWLEVVAELAARIHRAGHRPT